MHLISHMFTKKNGGVRFPPLGPHGWVITGFKQHTECVYSLEMVFDNKHIFQYKGSIGGVTIFDPQRSPYRLKFEKKNFQLFID